MTRVTVCVDVVQGEAVADRDGEPAVVRPDNLDVGEKGAVEQQCGVLTGEPRYCHPLNNIIRLSFL